MLDFTVPTSWLLLVVYWYISCCCCSVAKLCPAFCDPGSAAGQASLSFTISQSLLKLMFTESMIPSNHLVLCHSLLLLPSIFPSIRIFSNESTLHIGWPKYWRFNFSTSASNDCSELISFRTDWFDLAVQELNSAVLHCRQSFYCPSYQGSPLVWGKSPMYFFPSVDHLLFQ